MARHLTDALRTIATILPDQDFTPAHLEIASLASLQMHGQLA
ncbi:MAG TPA: hypothetical protein VGH36_13465 [Acetobacteraceae bacterium]|jgi:hypothetical protein